MKILHFIYSLSSGGAERLVVDLCNELSKNGDEIYLCTLRDDNINNNGFYKKEISTRVNYINLKLPNGFRFSNFRIIYEVIKKVQPNVVHSHQNLINYIFPIVIIAPQIHYFYTIHTDAFREVSNKLEYLIRRFFFKNKLVIPISISEKTSKSYIEFYKLPQIVEIVNGRQLPSKSIFFNEVVNEIAKYRINNNLIFVHIGRCNEVKNQEMLIKVFNKLSKENVKYKLLIIGAGFESELGIKLRELANENIIFLGEKYNVYDYLMNADAFCLSSKNEGMPITLIESLACGCISICTPVGGICDTIINGKNGYISRTISEEEYYYSIREFINKRHSIERRCLIEFYNNNFSIHKCASMHYKLYNRL